MPSQFKYPLIVSKYFIARMYEMLYLKSFMYTYAHSFFFRIAKQDLEPANLNTRHEIDFASACKWKQLKTA